MNDEEWEELQTEISDALSTVLSKYDKGFITKWVAVVEAISAKDGDRWFWSIAAKDNRAWDSKGLLKHALDIEQSETFLARLKEHDE